MVIIVLLHGKKLLVFRPCGGRRSPRFSPDLPPWEEVEKTGLVTAVADPNVTADLRRADLLLSCDQSKSCFAVRNDTARTR